MLKVGGKGSLFRASEIQSGSSLTREKGFGFETVLAFRVMGQLDDSQQLSQR